MKQGNVPAVPGLADGPGREKISPLAIILFVRCQLLLDYNE